MLICWKDIFSYSVNQESANGKGHTILSRQPACDSWDHYTKLLCRHWDTCCVGSWPHKPNGCWNCSRPNPIPSRGALVIGLGDSHIISAPHKVVGFRMSFLSPESVMILKSNLQNQENLLPPVQLAATHTLWNCWREARGKMNASAAEVTCSHDSLAIAILMEVPEVDGRRGTAFSPTDPRLLLHIKE